MGKSAIFSVIGLSLIAVLVLFSLSENTPSSITSSTSEPTETVITPITFQAESKTIPVSQKTFQSDSETILLKSLEKNSIPKLIQEAEAITSEQTSISVTEYFFIGNFDDVYAFDAPGNLFGGEFNEVSRIDITTNTQTTWTLPDDNTLGGKSADSDSLGFFYFTMGTNLVKLDHTTDVFTQWNFDPPTEDESPTQDDPPTTDDPPNTCNPPGATGPPITIDSSDDIYFKTKDDSGFLNKLDPVSNIVTEYFFPAELNFIPDDNFLTIDDSGLLYFRSIDLDSFLASVVRFDPISNEINIWTISLDFRGDIGVDNLGNMYILETDVFRTFLGQLDPSTNILKRWTDPFFGGGGPIVVDSSGNVFYGDTFTRFVPSTETFTLWDICADDFMEIGPAGKIRIGSDGDYFIIT